MRRSALPSRPRALSDRAVAPLPARALARIATFLLCRLGVPALCAAGVGLLYGDALHYAFLYDDGLDLARGEQRSVLSLLTSAEGAFYYRPIPFLVWKGMHAVLGWYDPFWFHLLPLAFHALNGWLVYRLARALALRPLAAGVAAALFLVFPFHYQAVPWAGAWFHPLVTALLLATLLAYRRARLDHSRCWLALSLGCTGLALFTHEYASTVGLLVAGLELWLYRQGQVRAPRPYALLYIALALGFALWWLAVPKWPRAFTLDEVSLVRNGLMFLQALLWPLAIGWRWAPPYLLAHPEAAVAVASALALPLAFWLYGRWQLRAWLLLALGWLVVTALPVWLTLPFEYLEDGARLYYLPGVGIALGWAALAQRLAPGGWRHRGGQVLLLALYGWAIVQSLDFLAVRRAMYAEGTALLRQAVAATYRHADGPVLFVNFPAWKAPAVPAFPLGNTGVTFVPEYVLLGQALHVNGGAPTPVESLATDALPGGWPAHYGPHGAWTGAAELAAASQRAAAIYLTRYTPAGPWLERVDTLPFPGE